MANSTNGKLRGGLLTALLCLLLPAVATAKNIYKFQDEDGIWHYTDKTPADGVEFEAVYMERAPEPRIRMRQEGSNESPVYVLFNDYWGPAEIELKLSESENVLTEPPLPARFVVPGQKEKTLVGLGPLDQKRGYRYRLNMASVPGQPIPVPVQGIVILPPFAPEGQFPISQGFRGGRTHLTPDSEYAVDIAMPVGTAIHAARAGVIMDVEEDFNKGGTDLDKFGDKANHVRILHEDGTMGLYAHLDLASVSVRPGARVRAGQSIARSGNTGFSSGPHLHFVIQQNVGMKLISVPFRFQTADGTTIAPVEKQWLKGTAGNP